MAWARRGILTIALGAVGAAGCIIGSKDFHPDQGTGGRGGSVYGTGGAGAGFGGSGAGGSGAWGAGVCTTPGDPAFTLKWSVVDESNATTTCAAVGATTMDVDVLNLSSNAVTHDTFPCSAMLGVGTTVAPGSYTVALRLRAADGALESEAIAPTSYTITAGCLTDLGNIPMQVAQSILFSWKLAKLATGAALSCAQGNVATIELIADGMSTQWPCNNAGKATSPALAPGDHSVVIKALDPQGIVLSATPSRVVTITAGGDVDLGVVPFDLN